MSADTIITIGLWCLFGVAILWAFSRPVTDGQRRFWTGGPRS